MREMTGYEEDISSYESDELSLRVFNANWLYRIRHRKNLKALLDEIYIYSDEQWQILKNDLAGERKYAG